MLKRRAKKKISLLNCSGEGSFGGAITYTRYLMKSLELIGYDVSFVNHSKIGDPDAVIMVSIGIHGEKNPEANKRRLENIDNKFGKIPFILIRHGVTELRIFKSSYEFFKDKEFDLIISVEDTPQMFEHITEKMKFKKLKYIGHPFEFTDSFCNKKDYKDWIASSARFAGCKNNDKVLQIADTIYPDKKFNVWGEEKGIYWFRAIKDSPFREKSIFRGRYTDYREIYKDSAFGIDLSYIHSGKFVDGNRTQYTVIEAIDCGAIPIGFDVWKSEGGYDGVWLPSPHKKGNRIIYDLEAASEIIRKAEYSYDMAKHNYDTLSEKCDYRVIAEHFKKALGEVI
jgi:hypothetical protein